MVSGSPTAQSRAGRTDSEASGAKAPAMVAWNVLVAASTALAGCLVLLGRALPPQATLWWLSLYALIFALSMVWLSFYANRVPNRYGATRHLL
ncbi:MAG TPA: hypothetical protein VHS28_08650, partial [Chloroflexota bacterium]|nr:hypothetical protein [Chloroflexota bacterium]